MKLINELRSLDFDSLTTPPIKTRMQARLQEEKLLMSEDPLTHFCVYTLPYDHKTKKVFLGHHIKANKWIAPGGHIEANETIIQTATREIAEELGQAIPAELIEIFFLSISDITSKPPRKCTVHFDIWVTFTVHNSTFIVDSSEFYDSRWFSIPDALAKTSDQANKDALEKFARLVLGSK